MKTNEILKIQELYENVDQNLLNEREKKLLKLLNMDQTRALFDELKDGKYRVIQFKTASFEELAQSLKMILPELEQIDFNQHFVIERWSNETLSKSELFDVFQTLSQDMGIMISAFVGIFVEQEELGALFEEERAAFSENKTFSEYLFSTVLSLSKSQTLHQLKIQLHEHPEDQLLVKSLYETSGNQAAAAKLLFVHRNTLLNKIKKFEKFYGLELSGSDLVLAYHLL
ncbi:helix-turn-helix domain-containing protein [Lactococcus hircilactis]|uniref:PucR family transcriptional regulator n=1 Tax=Lactococcus hircilactis TaxID=1494462 RepID=UPI003FA1B87E